MCDAGGWGVRRSGAAAAAATALFQVRALGVDGGNAGAESNPGATAGNWALGEGRWPRMWSTVCGVDTHGVAAWWRGQQRPGLSRPTPWGPGALTHRRTHNPPQHSPPSSAPRTHRADTHIHRVPTHTHTYTHTYTHNSVRLILPCALQHTHTHTHTHTRTQGVALAFYGGVPYIIDHEPRLSGLGHHVNILFTYMLVMLDLQRQYGSSSSSHNGSSSSSSSSSDGSSGGRSLIPDVEFVLASSDKPLVLRADHPPGRVPPVMRFCSSDEHADIKIPVGRGSGVRGAVVESEEGTGRRNAKIACGCVWPHPHTLHPLPSPPSSPPSSHPSRSPAIPPAPPPPNPDPSPPLIATLFKSSCPRPPCTSLRTDLPLLHQEVHPELPGKRAQAGGGLPLGGQEARGVRQVGRVRGWVGGWVGGWAVLGVGSLFQYQRVNPGLEYGWGLHS